VEDLEQVLEVTEQTGNLHPSIWPAQSHDLARHLDRNARMGFERMSASEDLV
jgi:hypothetical protein